MGRASPIFVLIASIAGFEAGLALIAAAPSEAAPASNEDAAVEATFTDASGKPVKLSDYRGKSSLVLLFMRGFKGDFACFHCGNQMRACKEGYASLHDAGAEVLAILPGATDVKGFLEKVGTS